MRSRATAYPLVAVLGWGVMFPILASALDRVDPLNLAARPRTRALPRPGAVTDPIAVTDPAAVSAR
ncbi:hypothetical protein [Micromonospora sp. NPDC005324]|uniref:hypothetical protein n=1 Tax=Micromonospora sp. NPDC005324 TaxID=3157033 RepID=UPI0033AA3A37